MSDDNNNFNKKTNPLPPPPPPPTTESLEDRVTFLEMMLSQAAQNVSYATLPTDDDDDDDDLEIVDCPTPPFMDYETSSDESEEDDDEKKTFVCVFNLSEKDSDDYMYDIPGGNDTDRQFDDIMEAINRAYMTGDAYNPKKDILRKLINRLILLYARQRGERKAVREGVMENVTVNCFFSFEIPRWKPSRDASNAECRRWIEELLRNLTPQE